MTNETATELKSAGLAAANQVLNELGWPQAVALERGVCGDPYNCAISRTIQKKGPENKTTTVCVFPEIQGTLSVGVHCDNGRDYPYQGNFELFVENAVKFTDEFDAGNFPELIDRRAGQ